MMSRSRLLTAAFVLSALVAGGVTGAAASGFLAASTHPTIARSSTSASGFARNAAGLTYGSAADATGPDAEPDLIRVMTDAGREAYVFKKDLDGPDVTTPAAAGTANQAAATKRTIPAYETDGKTRAGQFSFGGSPVTVVTAVPAGAATK